MQKTVPQKVHRQGLLLCVLEDSNYSNVSFTMHSLWPMLPRVGRLCLGRCYLWLSTCRGVASVHFTSAFGIVTRLNVKCELVRRFVWVYPGLWKSDTVGVQRLYLICPQLRIACYDEYKIKPTKTLVSLYALIPLWHLGNSNHLWPDKLWFCFSICKLLYGPPVLRSMLWCLHLVLLILTWYISHICRKNNQAVSRYCYEVLILTIACSHGAYSSLL